MGTDSSLKEGHVYSHASNYLAVDYQLIFYGNIANQIHGFTIDYSKFQQIADTARMDDCCLAKR